MMRETALLHQAHAAHVGVNVDAAGDRAAGRAAPPAADGSIHADAAQPSSLQLQRRRDQLLQVYQRIAQTRMRDLPILNPALDVAVLGLDRVWPGEDAQSSEPGKDRPELSDQRGGVRNESLIGVLITPWCVNLVRLPLWPHSKPDLGCAWLAPGVTGARTFSGLTLDFIGAHDPGLGHFEQASLLSPVLELADQAAALAFAQACLQQIGGPMSEVKAPAQTDAELASRRRFLFGRASA